VRSKLLATSLVVVLFLGLGALLGFTLGRRAGGNTLDFILAGSNDHASITTIELEYERTLSALLRDLGRATTEIAGGQSEIRSLRRELGESRRERDVARAELESYRTETRESFDSRDDGYQRLGALGGELIRRLQGDGGGGGQDAAEP